MADWFVNLDGATTGPHPGGDVAHWARTGQLPATALFWPDGGTRWLALGEAWPLLSSEATSTTSGPTQPLPPTGPHPLPPAGPQPQPPAPAGPGRAAVHALTDRLADFAGVERLEGFRVSELTSAAFRRYGREEVESHFATGLPGFTPELTAIESGWPKPWMFVRLLGGSAALFVAFLVLIQVFENANLLPGLILVGSFAVPLSTLVFFFEINTPRNISLYLVIHCMMVGGLISLALTLLFSQPTSGLGGVLDPVLTGVVEESAKLLAVFLITMRLPPKRYPWILNVMLFGAAVGAGFACFESAGYAFRFLVGSGAGIDLGGATRVIVVRGLLAPFGHVVWAALVAGALWRVKLDHKLTPSMLVHRRVLRMALVVMVLHAAWDFDLGRLEPPFLLRYLLLGALAWLLAFGMLSSGLKQIKAAQASAVHGEVQVSGATTVLRSIGTIGPSGDP